MRVHSLVDEGLGSNSYPVEIEGAYQAERLAIEPERAENASLQVTDSAAVGKLAGAITTNPTGRPKRRPTSHDPIMGAHSHANAVVDAESRYVGTALMAQGLPLKIGIAV